MHKTKFLLANRIRTPDGTVLQSFSTHHFVSKVDSITGETYFTYGGAAYTRRSVNSVPATCLDVYTDDEHRIIREAFHWGTYGPEGDQPLKYVALKDLTDDHINAILRTQKHIPEHIRNMFIDEIEYRIDNKE